MKILYLDCSMGAAGDMLTAALLELLPNPDAFIEQINALGLPGVHMKRIPSVKCGITGTRVVVTVDGVEEESHDDGPGPVPRLRIVRRREHARQGAAFVAQPGERLVGGESRRPFQVAADEHAVIPRS